MFPALGLFRAITCPHFSECNLAACIFSHQAPITQYEENTAQSRSIYDPESAGGSEPPPSKKRKLEVSDDSISASHARPAEPTDPVLTQQQEGVWRKLQSPKPTQKDVSRTEPMKRVSRVVEKPTRPASMTRPVSPPTSRKPTESVKEEKLVPRQIPQAPMVLKTRITLVEMLYKHMKALNDQLESSNQSSKSQALKDQELIKSVLDEEEKAATTLGSEIYRNAMSQRILQLKKMSVNAWQDFVAEKRTPKTMPDHNESHMEGVLTGLASEGEEIEVLKKLHTKIDGLETYGYVTKPPSTAEIRKVREAIAASGNYEVCDRCGTRFQVFPGRDAHGRLTTRGTCHYHWGKVYKGQNGARNGTAASYPCCGQNIGSEGCTEGSSHVFKVTDVVRLASLLQFETTPARDRCHDQLRTPVAFDCEMGYTTYGLELVRVTAISWPQKEELLDVLVRPYGEILDLNTRFSGVSQEQFAKALPYEGATALSDKFSEEHQDDDQRIRMVDSPAAARQLMFNLLTPETPLLGHAIDNDLNACRIIHPFIVDTVLLYPHPRGLPIRYGLKMLSAQFLKRSIQTGGETGHDSKEDSVATADLVRVKVAEKWKSLKMKGWKFEAGRLVGV